MSTRYEIRPGDANPSKARYATHSEALLALQKTAKQLGTSAKLPAGNHGGHWRASIDGLVVIGTTRRALDHHELEMFYIEGGNVDRDKLMAYAAQIAAIAGKQAVIGETDDEFWFVDKPAKPTKQKSKKKPR